MFDSRFTDILLATIVRAQILIFVSQAVFRPND